LAKEKKNRRVNYPNHFEKTTMFKFKLTLGNTLKFVLLLDGIRVGGSLGGVDELISKAFSNGLDVAESRLAGLKKSHKKNGIYSVTSISKDGSFEKENHAYTGGQQRDGLVDTTERRNINGLTTDSTGRTNTGGVFTGTSVDDGINENLNGVLVSEKVDDLKSVLDNASSHELLSVVATVHHERVGETLNDRALGRENKRKELAILLY
jgi:hypothetical protein